MGKVEFTTMTTDEFILLKDIAASFQSGTIFYNVGYYVIEFD